ncbi:MAG: exodeoxyribonuclease III [Xanthomonadales bacterium]|nr:exodeoxyribonuclease III [Xanthomonadales bacterium]
MRIISVNTNGIRAAARKGFFEWLAAQKADFVCIQETKAQQHQLDAEVFHPQGQNVYFSDAEKKGYSGTAIYTPYTPDNVQIGVGIDWFDNEGRWLQVEVGNLTIISVYMPSGSSKEERQLLKYDSMAKLEPVIIELAKGGRDVVICGDWNIAHKKIDIKNWRGNQKNSGFLPEERAWMDKLYSSDGLGMVDAFRQVDEREHQYTWWSNRGQAWANNTGWRLDYQVISPTLADKVRAASIYKEERFSDHAPLIIDFDYQVNG